MWLPAHRSPYGLDDPLDGSASALVRPYIDVYERECARSQRPRLALVLTAGFWADPDWHSAVAPKVAA